MVNAQDTARLEADLQAARQALAAFDVGSLLTDDGTYDEQAVTRHEQLKAAVEAAGSRLAEATPH